MSSGQNWATVLVSSLFGMYVPVLYFKIHNVCVYVSTVCTCYTQYIRTVVEKISFGTCGKIAARFQANHYVRFDITVSALR